MKKFILFDVNYLAYRAHYSTGQLSYNDAGSGVLFGVFKEIAAARSKFPDGRFVFCFDHGKGLRESLYPGYKQTRRNRRATEEEAAGLDSMRQQLNSLKTKLLDKMGYHNTFFQTGYEADDIIASFCKSSLQPQNQAIIYSDDKDLYQLLAPNVCLYKPRTGVTYFETDFDKEFGIEPKRWATVKAIAGCSSDDVVGVPGVGEATAAKYLLGALKKDSKKYKDIVAMKDQWKKNLPIVRLPLEGTKIPTLTKDSYDEKKWEEVVGAYGMATLTEARPVAITRKPLLKRD